MRAVGAAALLVIGCAHGPRPPLAVPPDLQPEVERVRKAATRLVALERLQAVAARLVVAQRKRVDPPVIGMIALRTSWAPGGSVAFVVRRPEGGVQVLYEARVIDELRSIAGFRRLADPRPLVGEEEEVWLARETVLAAFVEGRCDDHLDVIVLPREAPDLSFDVYPLPAPRVRWADQQITLVRGQYLETSRDGSMDLVVAGHRRFHVSADGRRVLDQIAMSGPCQVRSLDHVRGNGEFIELTDPAADLPNEAQLLESAVLGWSFRITARRGVWEVVRGGLTLVSEPAAARRDPESGGQRAVSSP